MQDTVILNDKVNEEWDKFVLSHPLGTIYHTSDWCQLISQTYDHKPFYLIKKDGNGDIKAGLPFFIIGNIITKKHISSLPGAQFCNPLLYNANEFDGFIIHILELIRQNGYKYFELKLNGSFPIQNKGSWSIINDYSIYTLDISRPLDEIFSSFHKSCIQRPINKMSKVGVKIVKGDTENDVNLFYNLYVNMRKQNGLLPQPLKFFLNMWQILSKKQLIEILHAEHKGEIISSIILLKFKGTVIYEYGASNPSMMHLNPSHFLLWESIKNAKSEGYSLFDFGRTASENEGLSLFKSRWGTKQEALTYYYIPNMKGKALIRHNKFLDKLMHNTVKKMPLSLSKFLGGIIFQQLP